MKMSMLSLKCKFTLAAQTVIFKPLKPTAVILPLSIQESKSCQQRIKKQPCIDVMI